MWEYSLINVPRRIFNLVDFSKETSTEKMTTSKACFKTTEAFPTLVK